MSNGRKITRSTRSGRPRSYSELYRNSREVVTSEEAAESSKSTTASPTRRTFIDWSKEYGYVLGDLRRLGIVTAVLVIAMVVAGFVL